ncbi:MAG: ATP-binding protein [Peptococcaceae bacterium]|jgi:DNA replication protein DnaC|nr:ATP-binding protein [Peptococcaceae bacterium]
MKSLKQIIHADMENLLSKRETEPSDGRHLPENAFGAVKPSCPLCADHGIIFEEDKNSARPCACMRQKNLRRRLRDARISGQLLECAFDQFNLEYYRQDEKNERSHLENAKKALQAAMDFTDRCTQNRSGLGLLFTGPVGSGKTFLAAAIANALTQQGLDVLFLVVPELLDEIKSTYDKRSETSEFDVIEAARTVQILILDDLGAHNYTEWTINKLYSIINYRLNAQLQTVITTNLSVKQMDECLGDRTTSRIFEMTQGYRLSCAQDIRLLKYQQRPKL